MYLLEIDYNARDKRGYSYCNPADDEELVIGQTVVVYSENNGSAFLATVMDQTLDRIYLKVDWK